MNMVTSNNGGTIFKKGNLIYDTTRGRNLSICKYGNNFFSEDGYAFLNDGVLSSKKQIVSVNDDIAESSCGLRYNRNGHVVKCNDGRSWSNVTTFEEFIELLAIEVIYPWKEAPA